ncbi:MAG TPA: hypothetical protein ENK32_12715 [Anaerolineae bacterium]|nr:hypothetical protein [Anaerolineae bacterium]
MSDDPDVDELKAEERLKIEIPVEDEEAVKADVQEEVDITAELRNLGRQFVNTLNAAWNSEERQRFETEVREGMHSFASEIDKAIEEVRSAEATEKVKAEASQVAEKVQASEVGQKALSGLASGLQWLSVELDNLATKFSAPEESVSQDEPAEKSDSE